MNTKIPVIQRGKQATDNTCSNVSLKCENCDNQESMKIGEYESYPKWIPNTNDPKIMCSLCLGYMHLVCEPDKKNSSILTQKFFL